MTTTTDQPQAAERRRAVAVPADRRLRLPLELPHRRADRPGRRGRLAVRSGFDAPSVFGSLLDREAGFFRFGPVRDQPPDRPNLRAGHERARDDLEDAVRLDRRPRCADHGPDRPRGRDHAAHPAAGRRRRRPHARSRRGVPRAAASRSSSSASPCSTTAARRRSGRSSTAAGTRATRRARGRRSGSSPILAARRSRATACGRGTCSSRATGPTARSRGPRSSRPRRTRTRPRLGSLRPIRFWRAWLDRGPDPRPPLARPDPALGARDQGPDLHADRRDGRGR